MRRALAIGTVCSVVMAGGAFAQSAAPAATTPAPESASAAPAAAAPAKQSQPKRAARAAPAPAAEASLSDKLSNFFRGNSDAAAKPAAAAPAKPQAAGTAKPATASATGGEARQVMATRAASSYSTSSNSLGFGLYKIVPKEEVAFKENYSAGTILVRQRERRLYYVLGQGKALKYAIAVGREGTSWSGTSTVSQKREWPDWTPTPSILKHQPDLPRHVEGGPGNPLGARALYLGATMYRIHGTNEPWRIGEEASSGCIRMTNDDVIDLYDRTRLGATVVVTH